MKKKGTKGVGEKLAKAALVCRVPKCRRVPHRDGVCQQCMWARIEAQHAAEREKANHAARRERYNALRAGMTHYVDAVLHLGTESRKITFYSRGVPVWSQVHVALRRRGCELGTDFVVRPIV